MPSQFRFSTACVAVFAGLTAALLLPGCADEPEGYHAGRVSPSETTIAEQNSAQIQPAALEEAAAQITQQFAQDLMQFPPIRDYPGRVTVVMGDLNNKTGIVSSDDFEFLANGIRNRLLQSQFLRGKIMFVESRTRLESLAAREGVAGAVPQYSRENTYTLNGNFHRVGRSADGQEANLYGIEFQLVNFASGEILPVGSMYTIKQWRK